MAPEKAESVKVETPAGLRIEGDPRDWFKSKLEGEEVKEGANVEFSIASGQSFQMKVTEVEPNGSGIIAEGTDVIVESAGKKTVEQRLSELENRVERLEEELDL